MKEEFDSIEDILQDIRSGKMVILVDDEDRENEGDLVMAAEHVTPEAINFMALHARGLICLAMSAEQVEKLKIPLMVRDESNTAPNHTAFTVSIEASFGVTTGISAKDRAHTVKVAAHPQAKPQDIRTPGHIFPLKAKKGGVLVRAGHTEGSVDLAVLSGLSPAAVICEIMNPDGSMARVPDLMKFAQTHGLKIGTIVDLINYRLEREDLVEEVGDLLIETPVGPWRARVFKSSIDHYEHLVLQKGEISESEPTFLRVQWDNAFREVTSFLIKGETDLHRVFEKIQQASAGVILLLRGSKPKEQIFQDLQNLHGLASSMDPRQHGVGAQILRKLGVKKIKLISDSTEKKVGLKGFDLDVVEIVPLKD